MAVLVDFRKPERSRWGRRLGGFTFWGAKVSVALDFTFFHSASYPLGPEGVTLARLSQGYDVV